MSDRAERSRHLGSVLVMVSIRVLPGAAMVMISRERKSSIDTVPTATKTAYRFVFCSSRVRVSTRTVRIRSRSTPAIARAICASTTPNLTPRLNREPRVSIARYLSRRASAFKCRGELDLPVFANVVVNQRVQQVEDGRRQHVHAEEAKIMARPETGNLEPQFGQGRVWLLDDLVDRVNIGPFGQPAAGERSVLVNQVLARRLDGGNRALLGQGQVDQLPGAAAGFGREIKMVPQQEQERLAGDKLASAPDRMAIALGLGLDREAEALLEIEKAAGLLFGPFHSLERRPQVGRVIAEMTAIDGLVTGRADDADLFDSAFECFLGDDLENRLGQTVAIDDRQHRFLHRVRCRILPRPPARRGDDRPGNLHVAWPLLPGCTDRRGLGVHQPAGATLRDTWFPEDQPTKSLPGQQPPSLDFGRVRGYLQIRSHHAGLGM